MNIGFHTDAFNSAYWSFERCLQWAHAHGVRFIECGLIDGVSWIHGLGYQPHVALYEDPALLRRKMDKLGVRFSQVDAAYPLSQPDGPLRGVPYVMKAIAWAAQIGCPCVDTTDGLHAPPGLKEAEAMALMKRSYEQILEVAEAHRIIVNIEPHGYFTTNPDRMAEMLAFVKSPWLRMNMDTGNTFIAGRDPGARLVAMCDIFPDRISKARETIRQAKGDQVRVEDEHCFTGFDGYKSVVESADVVLIANAAKFHPLHAMAAIAAGRHVFVEKPHGIDPAGVQLLRRAVAMAREKGLSIVSGLQSRYDPGIVETVQRIHDGAIGDVIAVQEQWLRAPYGVRERPPGMSELDWQCSAQYRFHWLSGDDVVQTLSHNLDRARWVLKEANPVHCHGLGGRSSMVEGVYRNVFDHHSVIYEFENGVRVYGYCRTIHGCYNEDSSLVFGTKGWASVKACRILGETTKWRYRGEPANPYQIEHDRLFAAIRSGEPLNNGDYMADNSLMAVMGQIACYTGEQLTWDQLTASDFAYPPRPEDCRDGMEAPVQPGPDGSYPVYVPGTTRLL
jgi:predicted dehydrogenase